MQNEYTSSKSWFRANIKWTLPIGLISLLLVIVFIFSIPVAGALDFGTALSDKQLYTDAVKITNHNDKVISLYGKIDPIDNLAIIESEVSYSKDKQSVRLTVRVSGTKLKGKMDVKANKAKNKWEYKFIQIRTKNTLQKIVILKK